MRLWVGARLALAFWSVGVPRAAAQDEPAHAAPSLLSASAGVVGVNAIAWTYNRYVQRWDWSQVGPDTWWQNLRSGFRWDDDALLDNQLAHPLQGAFYFNSARGAGFSFWAAVPFVAVGSLTWEFFAENVPPSPNDVINTTLGGAALGEVTSRVARLLARPGRHLAPRLSAVALDPLGRVQGWRWMRGQDAQEGNEPRVSAWLAVGTGRAPSQTASPERYQFLQLGLRHGGAFDATVMRPFDVFDFDLELDQRAGWQVRRVHVTGLLARSAVHRLGAGDIGFGIFQHYEFEAPPMALSAQSVSGALLYHWAMGREAGGSLDLHLEAILLGEVASDEGHAGRRDYDYAPGLGARMGLVIQRRARDLLSVQTRAAWLQSVYGSAARHLVVMTRVGAAVPLGSVAMVGGEGILTLRRSTYPTAAVHHRTPEFRAYLAWPGP